MLQRSPSPARPKSTEVHRPVSMQFGRTQLASVAEGQKGPKEPSSRPSTLGTSSRNDSATTVATATNGSRAASSLSLDRSEAGFRRAEAIRQYGSFDLPDRPAQAAPPPPPLFLYYDLLRIISGETAILF